MVTGLTGKLGAVIGVVLILVIAGIIGAFGLKLMGEFSSGLSNENATSAINYATEGIMTLFQYWPIIALAIVAGIVLTVIFAIFKTTGRRGR